MMPAWRLVKRRHSSTAFDGEGARLNGARWNSVGTRVAYASDSKALAVLEVLVHLQDSDILSAYDLVGIQIPEALIDVLDESALPSTWTDSPPPLETQAVGDHWIAAGRSVILAVPSAVIPGAANYLINPHHPQFHQLTLWLPEPFSFDTRLRGKLRIQP